MLDGKLIIIPALGHQNKGKSSFTGSGLFISSSVHLHVLRGSTATIYYFVYYINILPTRRSRLINSRFKKRTVAGWLSQTCLKNYCHFSRVVIQFFSVLEIPVKHSSFYDKCMYLNYICIYIYKLYIYIWIFFHSFFVRPDWAVHPHACYAATSGNIASMEFPSLRCFPYWLSVCGWL